MIGAVAVSSVMTAGLPIGQALAVTLSPAYVGSAKVEAYDPPRVTFPQCMRQASGTVTASKVLTNANGTVAFSDRYTDPDDPDTLVLTPLVTPGTYTYQATCKLSNGQNLAQGSVTITVVPRTHLRVGQPLQPSAATNDPSSFLQTSTGYRLSIENGVLVERNPQGQQIWSASQSGKVGALLTMQSDGNLVLSEMIPGGGSNSYAPIWNTSTSVPGSELQLLETGRMIVVTPDGVVVWQSSPAPTDPSTLAQGDWLRPGSSLVSPSGLYTLTLTTAGRLQITGPVGAIVWQTTTFGSGLQGLQVRPNGDLALVDAAGKQVWATGTRAGAQLQLTDNGQLWLSKANSDALAWSSADPVRSSMPAGVTITPERPMVSADGRCQAVIEATGVLEIDCAAGPVWSAGTAGSGAAQFVLTSAGNLELQRASGSRIWTSDTLEGTKLTLSSNGVLQLTSPNGTVVWSSAGRVVGSGELVRGQVLASGQSRTSANGRYKLTMGTDGTLTQYDGTIAIWQLKLNSPGAWLTLQKDGNLVAYSATGTVLWATNTRTGGTLTVQNDGNLVLYSQGGYVLWTKANGGTVVTRSTLTRGQSLATGQSLVSANGKYTLMLQTDGNLVEYAAGRGAIWASRTNGQKLLLQTDGNLVQYTTAGVACWSTKTTTGATLLLQDDGNLVLYPASGPAVWANGAH